MLIQYISTNPNGPGNVQVAVGDHTGVVLYDLPPGAWYPDNVALLRNNNPNLVVILSFTAETIHISTYNIDMSQRISLIEIPCLNASRDNTLRASYVEDNVLYIAAVRQRTAPTNDGIWATYDILTGGMVGQPTAFAMVDLVAIGANCNPDPDNHVKVALRD